MSRLAELHTLDRVIAAAIAREPLTLTEADVAIVAKHLHRLTERDRARAEQTRRAKIREALRGRDRLAMLSPIL